MKWLPLVGALFMPAVWACIPDNNIHAERIERFTNAMIQSDYVVVAEVDRLYQLPSWELGFSGTVVRVIADLKGYAPDYVDAALLPTAPYSPQPEDDQLYWSMDIGQLAIFSVIERPRGFYITAMADAHEEQLYRSCLALAKELAERHEKKLEEEEFKLPDHLKIDHLKEIFGDQ